MPSTEFETESRRANLHQSSLDSVLDCPRRFWFETLSDAPQTGKPSAAAGTATHAAIEAHEQARIDGNPDGISEDEMKAVAAASIADLAGTFTPAQLADLTHVRKAHGRGKNRVPEQVLTGLDALVAGAEDAIHNWWHAPIDETGTTCRDWLMTMTPLAVEKYATGRVAGVTRPLAGTLDGLYVDGHGRIRMVDTKTAKDFAYWRTDEGHRDQPAFYALLLTLDATLADLHPDLPARQLVPMTFVVVRRSVGTTAKFQGAKLMTVEPTQRDMVRLGDRLRAAEAKIAEGRFLPNPTAKWCQAYSCPIWDRCVGGDRTLAGPLAQAAARLASPQAA